MVNPIKKLKNFKRVQVLGSNHFVIIFENGNLLHSYNSVIAVKLDHKIYLTKDWDYSATTGRYRNIYLGEPKSETQKNIDNKIYTMI